MKEKEKRMGGKGVTSSRRVGDRLIGNRIDNEDAAGWVRSESKRKCVLKKECVAGDAFPRMLEYARGWDKPTHKAV